MWPKRSSRAGLRRRQSAVGSRQSGPQTVHGRRRRTERRRPRRLPTADCRLPTAAASNAEIFMQLVHIRGEFGIGEGVDDLAVLHDVVAVGDGRGEAEILLDQQDREALLLQFRDRAADLLDDDRARGPRSARRASGSARRCAGCARSRASAARRPRACRRRCSAAPCRFGKQREDALEIEPAGRARCAAAASGSRAR